MATATIDGTAPAISCDHCVHTIKQAVSKLAGVTSVDADAESKHVTVIYDPDRVGEDQIKTTLSDEGYPLA